jgi:hypothetical protein
MLEQLVVQTALDQLNACTNPRFCYAFETFWATTSIWAHSGRTKLAKEPFSMKLNSPMLLNRCAQIASSSLLNASSNSSASSSEVGLSTLSNGNALPVSEIAVTGVY